MSGAERTEDGHAEAPATMERIGSVAVITLNRPRSRNSVNAELSTAVGTALEQLEADPNLHVGIITGAGHAFCAGADLRSLAAGEPITAPNHPEWGFAGIGARG